MSHHDIAGIWVAFSSRCQRYRCGQEALDVALLAEAFEWAGDNDDTTAGQTYNLTNGDVFLWPNLWGAIAEVFGMVRTNSQRS